MASRSLGTLTLDIALRAGSFTAGMTAAERQADKSLSAIEKRAYKFGQTLGVALKAGAVAATAALTAVAAAVGTAINRADEMRDLSIRTGIATEKLSEYAYAAKQTGTDIDGLSRGLKLLAKNAAEAADAGSGKGKLFEALGINVKDAAGNLKQLDVLLPEVADKFKGLQDGTTKAAIAQELFGKSGLDLIEFLNQGSAGLTAAGKKVDEFGSKVGTEFAAQADEFNDKLGDLKEIANGFANQIAAELLPRLIELIDKFNDSAKEGELLGTTVKDIGSIFDLFAGQVKKADDVGSSFRLMLAATRSTVDSLRSGLSDLVSLDVGGFIKKMNDARQAATSALLAGFGIGAKAPEVAPPAARSRNARGGSNRTETGGPLTDVAAINKYLGGDPDKPKSPKKSGKSDEEKEADKLKAAYDRMNESLDEQKALFGKTGEAAKIRYELESGELSKLTDAQAKRLGIDKEALIAKAEMIDLLHAEADAEEALVKARAEQDRDFNNVNDAIKEQIALVGMTRDEMEVYNNLAAAGVTAESARGMEIAENTRLLQSMSEAMADQIELMDEIRSSGANFLSDWIGGSKSFKDSLLDAWESVHQKILQMISENLMEKLFGKQGDPAGGSSGDWLGGLVGALFGSSNGGGSGAESTGSLMDLFGGAWGFANGGNTKPWSVSRVNERGFEMATVGGNDYLLTGAQSVAITPNHKLGGGGVKQQVINMTVQGRIDRRTEQQIAREIGMQTRIAGSRA